MEDLRSGSSFLEIGILTKIKVNVTVTLNGLSNRYTWLGKKFLGPIDSVPLLCNLNGIVVDVRCYAVPLYFYRVLITHSCLELLCCFLGNKRLCFKVF